MRGRGSSPDVVRDILNSDAPAIVDFSFFQPLWVPFSHIPGSVEELRVGHNHSLGKVLDAPFSCARDRA